MLSLWSKHHVDTTSGLLSPDFGVTQMLDKLPDDEHFGPLLKVIRYDELTAQSTKQTILALAYLQACSVIMPHNMRYFIA